MPGQPITAAAIARMEAYGLDRILDRIINGELMGKIADDPHIAVSRPMLSRWLNGRVERVKGEPGKQRAAEREKLYREARALSAQSIVEDGLDVLDNETDPKASHLAKNRADFRLRLAENYDRTNFAAKQSGVNINLNIGDLHLDALRRRAVARPAEPVALLAAPDVEVVAGDDDAEGTRTGAAEGSGAERDEGQGG